MAVAGQRGAQAYPYNPAESSQQGQPSGGWRHQSGTRPMRIASFRDQRQPAPGFGVVDAAGLRPAPAGFRARYPDLAAVLAANALAELPAACAAEPALPLAGVHFLPVIPNPRKILCVGVNYLAHIREMGRERPDYPTLFVRFPDSLVGHGQPLRRPRASLEYDYEGELAFVIGRPARDVPVADALTYIAGYTVFMDGSVRDFQRHTSQFIPGKNFPATGSCGPWLVTTEEIPDPAVLKLTTRVNGEVLQRAPVSDLCITVPEILAYCSRFCRLEPGDIIATGTPAGVGFARTPPRWLRAGDTVAVEISGIGELRNPVQDEQ
jgi:2-keto-4-pentenoate hydratase/2-oxohepta-3-ene-1,7-dioic acid hydratase in catechol pathway